MVDTSRFENRVALITGAGSDKGIGFATAQILARQGAGVAITSTTDRIFERAKELEDDGLEVRAYVANLMARDQVKQLVDSVIRDFSRVDILVNNAGMVQVGKEETFVHMVDLPPTDWDESIDRNLNTCFNITHTVLPRMIENHYGRIVNVSSVTGPLVSNPGETGYSAAVWTDLNGNFKDETGVPFSHEQASSYLQNLPAESLHEAWRYITYAPAETNTPFRRYLSGQDWWQSLSAVYAPDTD